MLTRHSEKSMITQGLLQWDCSAECARKKRSGHGSEQIVNLEIWTLEFKEPSIDLKNAGIGKPEGIELISNRRSICGVWKKKLGVPFSVDTWGWMSASPLAAAPSAIQIVLKHLPARMRNLRSFRSRVWRDSRVIVLSPCDLKGFVRHRFLALSSERIRSSWFSHFASAGPAFLHMVAELRFFFTTKPDSFENLI